MREAFRDRAEEAGVRRDLSHESHSVRQRNTRGYAVRNVPARSDLMSQQMRETEACIHRAVDRIPRRELAVPTMRHPLIAFSTYRRG